MKRTRPDFAHVALFMIRAAHVLYHATVYGFAILARIIVVVLVIRIAFIYEDSHQERCSRQHFENRGSHACSIGFCRCVGRPASASRSASVG